MVYCVSIGNSDNKLTQQEWSAYVKTVDDAIVNFESHRHFYGGSVCWVPWQNVAWVFEMDISSHDLLCKSLTATRLFYKQDSVFIMRSNGCFI